MKTARCARCGRKLIQRQSIEDGMGKVCKRKAEAELVRELKLDFEGASDESSQAQDSQV